jgi:hypothetical protein
MTHSLHEAGSRKSLPELHETARAYDRAEDAMVAHFIPDIAGLAAFCVVATGIGETVAGNYKAAIWLGVSAVILALGSIGGNKLADTLKGEFGQAEMDRIEAGPLSENRTL